MEKEYPPTLFYNDNNNNATSSPTELFDLKNKTLFQDYEKLCDWENVKTKCKKWLQSTVCIAQYRDQKKSDIFSFPLFSPSFCSELVQEIKQFINKNNIPDSQGIEGISLHQFKEVNPFINWITENIANLASKNYSGDKILYKLEPYYFNVVYYKAGGESVEHPVHVDDSDLTINVSLSNNCDGGELFYFNYNTKALEIFNEHPVGSAIMHLGRLPHGAKVVSAGERFNLIMWFKKADKFHQFSSLPSFLQQKVISNLSPSPRDFLGFCATCKQFQAMSNDDVIWAELYKANNFGNVEPQGSKQKFVFQYTKQSNFTLKIWQEIVETEKTYVQSLQTLCDEYLKPLVEWKKKTKETYERPYQLATIILQQHKKLLQDSQNAISNHDCKLLCGAFLTLFSNIQFYKTYMLQYEELIATFQEKSNKKKIEQLKKPIDTGLAIESYVIMPIRRIPRYLLLLKDLNKHMPDGLGKCQVLQAATIAEDVQTMLNNTMKMKQQNNNN